VEYTLLPNTSLVISRIGLGCEPLGGSDWGPSADELSVKTIQRALDQGINLFDTADVYGLGHSETLLSKALGRHRYKVVIVSKGGVNWTAPLQGMRAHTFTDATKKHLVGAVERSLRRLAIDCIPIYLVHRPDPNTPIQETIDALVECQTQGKLRYFGLSNFPVSSIQEAQSIARLGAIQLEYSLITTDPERLIIPYTAEQGIGVLAYGTLGQGLLTGKYNRHGSFPHTDRRRRLQDLNITNWDNIDAALSRIQALSKEVMKDVSQIAVRWVLDSGAVSTAIVGAKSPAQVDNNIGCCGWRLSDEERALLRAPNAH